MGDTAIRVHQLGKMYRLGARRQPYSTLRESLIAAAKLPFRWVKRSGEADCAPYIWALKDVSFEVKQGEVLGIIGRNGAGKSTLLKILSRITEPTEGYAEIRGRVGSLLEVGTGFHPELTGRENIFLSGAVLGMRRQEIARKFDEIVSFAEIERFLDTPVKHYSSGMYMRLAFAVAAHLEPEILLVDEVLAVGDAAFQKKCLGRMGSIVKQGRTILFVSHNLAAITALCASAMLLERGQIAMIGTTQTVIDAYLSSVERAASVPLHEREDRAGNGRLRLIGLTFGADDETGSTLAATSGRDLTVRVSYVSQDRRPLSNVSLSLGIYGPQGQFLILCSSEMTGVRFEDLPPQGRLCCTIPRLPLAPGSYDLNLYCEVNGVLADWVQQAARLTVNEGDYYGTGRLPPASHGGLLVPQIWTFEK